MNLDPKIVAQVTDLLLFLADPKNAKAVGDAARGAAQADADRKAAAEDRAAAERSLIAARGVAQRSAEDAAARDAKLDQREAALRDREAALSAARAAHDEKVVLADRALREREQVLAAGEKTIRDRDARSQAQLAQATELKRSLEQKVSAAAAALESVRAV